MEAVAEKVKPKLCDLTYDQLVVFRNKASEQIREAEAVVDGIKAKREKIDIELLRRFNEQGVTNVKTGHGTPYIIKRESYSVGDKDAYLNWIKDNIEDRLDFLEIRASKPMIEVYKEQHEDIPPGVNYSAKLTIGVKKS